MKRPRVCGQRWSQRRTIATIVIALLSIPVARADPSQDSLTTVEVVGAKPGPGLWRVHSGDNVLWILGTLEPLPRRMIWRSREIEAVLDRADLVLAGGASASVDGGPITWFRLYRQFRRTQRLPGQQTLADFLQADDYQRFTSLRERYARRDRDVERFRPIFAAFRLFAGGVAAAGLTADDDIQERVLKLARKRRVERKQIKLKIAEPHVLLAEIATTAPQTEVRCLQAAMTRLETDLDALRSRALAWAEGNIAELQGLALPDDREACWDAIQNAPRIKALAEQARDEWLQAAIAALEVKSTTLALTDIYSLWGKRGLLDEFRKRGYEVQEPN